MLLIFSLQAILSTLEGLKIILQNRTRAEYRGDFSYSLEEEYLYIHHSNMFEQLKLPLSFNPTQKNIQSNGLCNR